MDTISSRVPEKRTGLKYLGARQRDGLSALPICSRVRRLGQTRG